MNERETKDFMSVDSFSQLPFIRPAPPARDKTSAGGGIRLFGIEFANESEAEEEEEGESKVDDNPNRTGSCNFGGGAASGGGGGDGAGRKFECHYCCRNFPTSQALGGHQNAHKRERQHARRAHLQSAMAAHQYHHQALGGIAEGHVYGLVSYHRLGSAVPAARFGVGHALETPPPTYCPSWVGATPGAGLMGARFYGGPGSISQPINGSPLPELWRIPPVQGGGGAGSLLPTPCDRAAAVLPLLGGEGYPRRIGGVVGVGGGWSGDIEGPSFSSPSPAGRFVHESAATVQDQLSLDLHL